VHGTGISVDDSQSASPPFPALFATLGSLTKMSDVEWLVVNKITAS
jgi:hypothetical protein